MQRGGSEAAASQAVSESRRAEQLIALLRYEMEDGRGCGSSELIEEIIGDVRNATIHQFDGPDDLTDEQSARIDRDVLILADHLVMALVASGHADAAEAMIESIALRRSECDAKFGTPRSVPFSHREREQLAKQWDASAEEVH